MRNLIAGVQIFQDKRLTFGQVIQVPGTKRRGVVEDIRLRKTVIRLENGNLCHIPNVLLAERSGKL